MEWRNDPGYSFLIFRRDDDALLGGITLSNVRRGVAQTASLGYWIGEPYARQGYMTEALLRCCPSPSTGWACTASRPPACRTTRRAARLLRKLGFREEGYARDISAHQRQLAGPRAAIRAAGARI